MPSKENMCVLLSDGSPKIDVPEFKITPSQVEELVSGIKDNLHLSAAPGKSKQSVIRKSSRASPYSVSGHCKHNFASKSSCVDYTRKRHSLRGYNPQRHDETNALDELQNLIREGKLIQEAIRRVQLGLTPKQRYFYSDSDEDEPRSPGRRCFENCL